MRGAAQAARGRRHRAHPCRAAGVRATKWHLQHAFPFDPEHPVSGISDRKQEIKRRRHRRQKLGKFQQRLKKATVSEKAMMAEKIRKLTPGAEVIIKTMKLEER